MADVIVFGTLHHLQRIRNFSMICQGFQARRQALRRRAVVFLVGGGRGLRWVVISGT